MAMNLVLAIGLMIVVGFFGGMIANRFKLPRITGYIIIGILLSPSITNLIPRATISNLDVITDIALGVIAFFVGSGLQLDSLKGLGKSIAWITPFESLSAWIVVTMLVVFLSPFILYIPGATLSQTYFPMAFMIGAVSCATAPAATIAVINEYKAKGPLTTTLLAVVGLDDAIAVIAFTVALGISQGMASVAEGISLVQMIGLPLLHIVGSILVGLVFGFILIYIAKLVKSRELLLVLVFGIILLSVGVSTLLDISLILTNMVIGFIVVNKVDNSEMVLAVKQIEGILFAMFFVLAGLHFDLSVMKAAGILAALIVIGRCTGKYIGARTGASISHAQDKVKKYLGFGLLPKAGVTVGLVLLAEEIFPTFGAIMVNGVLASVIVNELIAPPLMKYAIFKAGEQTLYRPSL